MRGTFRKIDDPGATGAPQVNEGGSTLVNRNVFVGRRRTSVRLEPAMWDALGEICRRENTTLHELCEMVDARRRASSLTAAIRVFVMAYFRAAATEDGHAGVGHGPLYEATRPRPRRVHRRTPANATCLGFEG